MAKIKAYELRNKTKPELLKQLDERFERLEQQNEELRSENAMLRSQYSGVMRSPARRGV